MTSTVVPFPRCLARFGDFATGKIIGGRAERRALVRKCFSAAIGIGPYTARLVRALSESAPDLLHSNGFKMHVLGLWSRQLRVPVVWHIRDHIACRPIMARLMRRHSGWCAAAVTNSRRVADDLRSVCGDRLNIYSIHDGIDLTDFSPSGPALDLDTLSKMPPANFATVRVGLLATMARWKGHAVFLRALASLPASLPIRGYIVGGPLYQTEGSEICPEELRALASELGIAQKVGFAGLVDEPAAAMRALDIVIHASTEPEPFGRVIGEAMACGRAVIASDGAGAVELLTAGVDLLTHPRGDSSLLAQRIAALATDPDLRTSLGRHGRATAERCFDHMRPAREMISIYRALTSAAN